MANTAGMYRELDCHITLFDTHPGNVLYDENEDKWQASL